MKILNVLLAAMCFSSFVYAGDFSYLTDSQKKESMISYRNSKVSQCVNENIVKATQNNKIVSGQEKKYVTDSCSCIVDIVIEDFLGEKFILNNDINTITKEANNYLDNKDQMIPYIAIEGCASKK